MTPIGISLEQEEIVTVYCFEHPGDDCCNDVMPTGISVEQEILTVYCLK